MPSSSLPFLASSTMNINELNLDCFIHILNNFSLQEQLKLRTVHPHWRWAIEFSFKCKGSLKLFGSFRALATYYKLVKRYNSHGNSDFDLSPTHENNDHLIIKSRCFTIEIALMLIELFPNVCKLSIVFYNWPSEIDITLFLYMWPNLCSLTLYGLPYDKAVQSEIWSCLNRMEKLQRVHLFKFASNMIPTQQGEKFLRRLTQFSITDWNMKDQDDLVTLLSSLGPNCKRLLMDNINCTTEQLEKSIQNNPDLSKSLTHLIVGQIVHPRELPRPQQPVHDLDEDDAFLDFHPIHAFHHPPPPPAPNFHAGMHGDNIILHHLQQPVPNFRAPMHGDNIVLHRPPPAPNVRAPVHGDNIDFDENDEAFFNLNHVQFANNWQQLLQQRENLLRRRMRRPRPPSPVDLDISLFEFLCSGAFQSLHYLDVTFLLSNCYEKIKLDKFLTQFAKLPLLVELRLPIYAVDEYPETIPILKSVRCLYLELMLPPTSIQNLMMLVASAFPELLELKVECYDQDVLAQLKSTYFLGTNGRKHFPNLRSYRLSLSSDMRTILPPQNFFQGQYQEYVQMNASYFNSEILNS